MSAATAAILFLSVWVGLVVVGVVLQINEWLINRNASDPDWDWGPTSIGWVRAIDDEQGLSVSGAFEEWADRWTTKPEPSDPQESTPKF